MQLDAIRSQKSLQVIRKLKKLSTILGVSIAMQTDLSVYSLTTCFLFCVDLSLPLVVGKLRPRSSLAWER